MARKQRGKKVAELEGRDTRVLTFLHLVNMYLFAVLHPGSGGRQMPSYL